MSETTQAIIETRGIADEILAKILVNLEGKSEKEVADRIWKENKNYPQIFETGWYVPPPHGLGVLFATPSYERLGYESLRKPENWPRDDIKFKKDTVALIYSSSVHYRTGFLGDTGLTIYQGSDKKIRDHLFLAYKAILNIANEAKVGMSFSDLCKFAENSYQNKFKRTRWVTISSDPNQTINIGHTVPGSFKDGFVKGNTFEETKEQIRTKRRHVIDTENFIIPETCAFTVESRIESLQDTTLPSAYFHFIICFDQGKKTILNNFDKIFKAVGMNYMISS